MQISNQHRRRAVLRKAVGVTWGYCFDAFMLRCDGKNVAAKTRVFYHEKLSHLKAWASMPPQDVTTAHLREFLSLRAKTASTATVDGFWRVLRTFFGFLRSDGLLDHDPTDGLDRPRREEKIPVRFTPDTLLKVLAVMDQRSGLGARDYALTLLYADTGARLGELLALTVGQVDTARCFFKVNGKGGKDRFVSFGARTGRSLSNYLRIRADAAGPISPDAPLFINRYGERMKPNGYEQRLKMHTVKAGVAEKRLNAHALRHFYTIEQLKSGRSAFLVQEDLGHSTLEMTKEYARQARAEITALEKPSPVDSLGEGKKRVVL